MVVEGMLGIENVSVELGLGLLSDCVSSVVNFIVVIFF